MRTFGYYTGRIKTHLYTLFLRHSFHSFPFSSLITYKARELKGTKDMTVGSNCAFGLGVRLTTWDGGHIIVGNDCHFGDFNHLTAAKEIIIGDGLLTGTNVLISDNSHGGSTMEYLIIPPIERPLIVKGAVHIAENVWIGNNVCILSGVSIGRGAVIAANSVVTHDVPAYSVVGGVPARIIKYLQKN